ncbi:MAG: flagellar basal body L-ring protein FlgH [Planctomycetaceae bacterium]|nr:flagellar basal body L-ring protein FlgH [Planctomycetaceae bacterium]
MHGSFRHARYLLPLAVLALLDVATAMAQSSSMLGDANERGPLRLSDVSYSYVEVEPPKELRIHDLITVMVDESAQVISEGEMDRRKKADGKFSLEDWIIFDGLAAIPDPQSKGTPKITGKMENKYRAEGELETRESMRFRIACEIVDIRPNGTIVLEGRRSIQANTEQWELSLTGIARPEDILPNNTVLSEDLASLRIYKREAGHVRDGYRRGWFLRILDRYQPF